MYLHKMNKQTKMWIGAAAVAVVGFYLYNRSRTTSSFSGGTFLDDKKPTVLKGQVTQRTAQGCVIYDGACMYTDGGMLAVKTIIDWQGGQGIVVANSSTRCIVCPKSNTADGMPSQF